MEEILKVLSVSLFEKAPVLQAFSNDSTMMSTDHNHNQPPLFDF